MLEVAYLSYRAWPSSLLALVSARCNLNLASGIIFRIFLRPRAAIFWIIQRGFWMSNISSVLNLEARFWESLGHINKVKKRGNLLDLCNCFIKNLPRVTPVHSSGWNMFATFQNIFRMFLDVYHDSFVEYSSYFCSL